MKPLLLATALLCSAPALADIEISDARVRAMPPGSPMSAAFMKISNSGDADLALTRAASDAAARTELHTHTMTEGAMQMRQVPSIPLPAGSTVELKPGGYHLMLIGLERDLKPGDSVRLSLKLSDGSSRELEAPVVMVRPVGMKKHGHPEGGHKHH